MIDALAPNPSAFRFLLSEPLGGGTAVSHLVLSLGWSDRTGTPVPGEEIITGGRISSHFTTVTTPTRRLFEGVRDIQGWLPRRNRRAIDLIRTWRATSDPDEQRDTLAVLRSALATNQTSGRDPFG